MNVAYVYNVSANNGGYIPGVGNYTGTTCAAGNETVLVDDCNSGRHFGGINMAFADGHVKWLPTSTVIQQGKTVSPSNGAWNPANS